MSRQLNDFFKVYVLAPYEAWIEDELCEWKAFSVASGINAMVEHAFRNTNMAGQPGTPSYQKQLGEFRRSLSIRDEQEHIRCVVEVYKHVELKEIARVPNSFDQVSVNDSGAFSSGFSSGFDVIRPQIGFPYKASDESSPEWMPLRQVVESCITFWESHLKG